MCLKKLALDSQPFPGWFGATFLGRISFILGGTVEMCSFPELFFSEVHLDDKI